MSLRRVLSFFAATVLALATLPLLGSAAHAAHGSESHADSQFLQGTLLPLDLSTVLGIDGASAEYLDGHTPGIEDAQTANLDITALSLLNLNLPALTVTVGELLDLGVINQQAVAERLGVSSADTGTASLSLDLMALLPMSPAVTRADLNLGAVSSHAVHDANPDTLTRTTTIADATLDLNAPVIGDLIAGVNSVMTQLTNALNGLTTVVETSVDSAVVPIINLVGGVTGTATTDTTVAIDVSRLNTAIASLLDDTLTAGLVSIDLTTGIISVDLEAGIDLNNIPPNSTLLSPAVLQAITADVETLLGELQADLNDVITDATSYVDVTIDSNTAVKLLGATVAGLSIDYDGSLEALLDGTADLDINGDGVLGALPIGAASNLVQGAVSAAVTPALGSVVAETGIALDEIVSEVTDSLALVFSALEGLVAVNLNVQNIPVDPATEEAWVTAVQVQLLDGSGLELNLATSSVGPNKYVASDDTSPDVAITAPADGSTINDSTPTIDGTVSDNITPNADNEVTVVITDTGGDDVFTGPATVNPDGTWTIDATALPDGDYTATATATDEAGNTATDTTDFTIDAPVDDTVAPPVITAPGNGDTIADSTPTITGTAPPGSVTVDVTITNPDGSTTLIEDVPVTDGSWSVDAPELSDGDYIVEATATNEAGDTSPPSEPVNFEVDTTAPAVEITDPTDGDSVNDSTPPITGTVDDPDADVVVTITDEDGDVVAEGPATVDEDGDWTFTPSTPLPDGDYTVSAEATDSAENTSTGNTVGFTVDTSGSGAGPGTDAGAGTGTGTPAQGGHLPATGSSLTSTSTALLGLFSLLMIGAGILMLRRREA